MESVRYGVIGLGMGTVHIEGIRSLNGAEVTVVCDIDVDKLNKQIDKLGKNVHAYTDYRQVLEDKDVDAVVIAAPDQEHCKMVLDSLDAGKHVLCEKPLALSLDECTEMVKASQQSDKKFMIGQICRFTPGFMQAKKMIDAGEIGELFFVESEYAHDYSHIPKTNDNWRLDPMRHGFLGGGCHAVDLLRWIAGNPYEVSAFSNKKMLTTWPTDDCTIAIMKFPNDVIGKVFVSTGCKRNYTMRSAFYGSKGTIITDNTSPQMSVFKTDSCCGFTVPMMYPISINNHNAAGEIAALTDCIVNDKPVETDAYEGACTVAAALAAIRASKSGQVEKINYEFI